MLISDTAMKTGARRLHKLCRIIRGKRGAEMVEAAIVYPILIIACMLMIRLFTFYLEILNTGIADHMKALEAWDSYSGAGFRTYTDVSEVKMIRGGLLVRDVSKRIETKAYMLNEDLMVRAGEAL